MAKNKSKSKLKRLKNFVLGKKPKKDTAAIDTTEILSDSEVVSPMHMTDDAPPVAKSKVDMVDINRRLAAIQARVVGGDESEDQEFEALLESLGGEKGEEETLEDLQGELDVDSDDVDDVLAFLQRQKESLIALNKAIEEGANLTKQAQEELEVEEANARAMLLSVDEDLADMDARLNMYDDDEVEGVLTAEERVELSRQYEELEELSLEAQAELDRELAEIEYMSPEEIDAFLEDELAELEIEEIEENSKVIRAAVTEFRSAGDENAAVELETALSTALNNPTELSNEQANSVVEETVFNLADPEPEKSVVFELEMPTAPMHDVKPSTSLKAHLDVVTDHNDKIMSDGPTSPTGVDDLVDDKDSTDTMLPGS
ncbi:MAG: hypothetical protein P1U36_06365 [Legionellaceae bacterium]|nr:hypothetical protein [Legionellaceae bacterium]